MAEVDIATGDLDAAIMLIAVDLRVSQEVPKLPAGEQGRITKAKAKSPMILELLEPYVSVFPALSTEQSPGTYTID